MARALRPVGYDIDEVTKHVCFDELSEEDMRLISTLGFPGADELVGTDRQTSRDAVRRFVRTYLTASDDE